MKRSSFVRGYRKLRKKGFSRRRAFSRMRKISSKNRARRSNSKLIYKQYHALPRSLRRRTSYHQFRRRWYAERNRIIRGH